MADERARLFVALRLPDLVRDALAAWRADVVRDERALRPIPPEHLHLTLCFLGWRGIDEAASIAAACAVVADQAAADLRLGGAIWLPRRRPRVLAVELVDAAARLRWIQAALSEELARGGWYEPEDRPFLAHVTVARVRSEGRIRARELPAPPELDFRGSEVSLYRSRLARGGASYEALATVQLGST